VLASSGSDEAWFEDVTSANAAVTERLRIPADQLDTLRRRITVDPVVVRRDGARWRSRQVWSFRNETASVRVFEMLLIDEELYDH
jgi:ethanolamine ammonia-lyase small subunit